jgi:hypothetical protein
MKKKQKLHNSFPTFRIYILKISINNLPKRKKYNNNLPIIYLLGINYTEGQGIALLLSFNIRCAVTNLLD